MGLAIHFGSYRVSTFQVGFSQLKHSIAASRQQGIGVSRYRALFGVRSVVALAVVTCREHG